MSEKNYTGFSDVSDAQGSYGATSFVVSQIMNKMATTTLVLVKAVNEETVDVQPMISQIDGAGNAIKHGTINALPFFALRAGASAIIAKPRVGDIGLAVFCHNDISKVKKNKKPSPPGSWRRYDWADGIYLGGVLGPTATQFIKIGDDDGIEIHAIAGKPLKLIADTVSITGKLTVSDDVTVTGKVTASVDVIGGGKNLKTHTHSGVTAGGGNSGPPV
jgi:GpV Apex motif